MSHHWSHQPECGVKLKGGTVVDKWSWRDLPLMRKSKKNISLLRVGKPEPETDEMFRVGENVKYSKIINSTEPYNEFFLSDMSGKDTTVGLLNDTVPVYMVFVTDMTKIGMDQWKALLPVLQRLDAAHAKYFGECAKENWWKVWEKHHRWIGVIIIRIAMWWWRSCPKIPELWWSIKEW